MGKLLLVLCSLVLCIPVAVAKDKLSSQWKCEAKGSDEHSINVGDQPGHAYHISQGKCTSEKGSMGGVKEQEGTWTQFDDVAANGYTNHGVFIVTLASGDKVNYNYHGSATTKDGKMDSGSNTWTINGGTGKVAGAKGEGGCKGQGNPDGSSTWNCDGTYSVGK